MTDRLAPSNQPLDERRAARLLRRAGFGAPAGEIDRAVRDGIDATLERLFGADGAPDPAIDELDGVRDAAAAAGIDSLRGWWFARFLRARAQAREKVALFWHGHFATSFAKVNDVRLMRDHLAIFIEHGLAPLRDLLGRVTRDPAMLVWLDGEDNTRGKPNENYARELFELFTLGIGHYDEHDVKESARALTGFHRSGGRHRFVPRLHDDSEKEVLGRRGRLGPDDILDLCCAHPATARRLARRLVRFFAHPDPPDDVVETLAQVLRDDELRVEPALRRLFRSRFFLEETPDGVHVASPVEFVAGVLRTLETRVDAVAAARFAGAMGQRLLEPPSVKGWDGETAWIHAAGALAALDFAFDVARGGKGACLVADPPARLAEADAPGLSASLAAVARRLVALQPAPDLLDRLARALEEDAGPRPSTAARIAAVLTLPEVRLV